MLGDGGPVEMRLGDATYAPTATPARENWRPVLEAYVDKYQADYPDIVAGFPPISEARDQVAVFRLNRS